MASPYFIGRGVSDQTAVLSGFATGEIINYVEGATPITNGLDLSSVGQFASINVTPSSMRRIGGPSPLKVGVSGTFEFRAQGGGLIVQPANTTDSGSTANTIAKFLAAGSAQTSVDFVGGGTVTNLFQTSGNVTVAESVTVTNASFASGSHAVEYSATGLSQLYLSGGSLTLRRGIANSGVVKLMGGKLLWSRVDSSTNAAITIGTSVTIDAVGPVEVTWKGGNNSSATTIAALNLIHPGSRFYWQDMPADTTITTVTGHPEALLASGLTNPASSATYSSATGRTLTITNALSLIGVTPAKQVVYGAMM